MNLEDFQRDFPAIWLVFAGTYLDHSNSGQTSFLQRKNSPIKRKDIQNQREELTNVREDSPTVREDSPNESEDSPNESEDSPNESGDSLNESEDSPNESEDSPNEREDSPYQQEDSLNQSEKSSNQQEVFDKRQETPSNECEKSLVDLLCAYLDDELVNSTKKQLYDEHTSIQLRTLRNLLDIWSHDLELIYRIRKSSHHELELRQVVQRFLKRIRTLEDSTVIPNGLISAGHTEKHENINLAILKKRGNFIDWIQVNPGSAYHQHCSSFAGDKSNAYLEITGINPQEITEEWLYLLVGLKAVNLGGDRYYKDVSLYECLLAHLNGTTEFQTETDENFVFHSNTSPAHTWQVIDKTLRYLLQHFLGKTYLHIYRRLLTGFKMFLVKETFNVYQNVAFDQIEKYHYLLQEMCQQLAQQALDHGDREQKDICLTLIDTIKAMIDKRCNLLDRQIAINSQLNEPHVFSLSFVAPNIKNYAHIFTYHSPPSLKTDPQFINPRKQHDIIDYLKYFKSSFINELVNSTQLNEVVILTCGIEAFLFDYLAETDILQIYDYRPFSKDDIFLANTLNELAEIYYGCQGQLVKNFLSNMTYQPLFYAKNVIVQFFTYAVIAALNLRDKNIGPLLSAYNLSTETSYSLSLNKILCHLVIDDARYLKVLSSINVFFENDTDNKTLFSWYRFIRNQLTVRISNTAEKDDIDVEFAYKLLQQDYVAYGLFNKTFSHLNEENFSEKWERLTYTEAFLPSLFCDLSKIAHLAKASLTGFPRSISGGSRILTSWYFANNRYWASKIHFNINSSIVSVEPESKLTSYVIKSGDPYQRLINNTPINAHILENEIIASRDMNPAEMEYIRYIHLGFLQSEPRLKLERLYIAIKEQYLDFCCEQESVLIKQTLFEISVLTETEAGLCSLLQRTVQQNPLLIHKLGLLCVEKALAMKHRLTQHPAISEILEVVLGLLTFYPRKFKKVFIDGITEIYCLLKYSLTQKPTHLSDHTLLHLSAYLIIVVQAKPQLIETETLTILTAIFRIQHYKVINILLDKNLLRRMYISTFTWSALIESRLKQNPELLNDFMLSIIPQWNQTNSWQKSQDSLLFVCGNYAVKPLSGIIYFQNKPIELLPATYTEHKVFKEYLGNVSFGVISSARLMNGQDVPCFLSVGLDPQLRFTFMKDTLFIEEWIQDEYLLYIPVEELLGCNRYPRLFYQLPECKDTLRHWLHNSKNILIKDQQRQIIYEWELEKNTVFSLNYKGYLVPLEQLKSSFFKTWLERIELSEWIEIIAEPTSQDSVINIQSLHFPRLGLHFKYKQGLFFSLQIHRYYLAKQQHLKTLKGFSNYLVLETKHQNSINHLTKVVIPYRKITPCEIFYMNIAIANHPDTIHTPPYFVYEFDKKTGLLKANTICAQLYLSLIYYCTTSLYMDDITHCNAFHLARENLEICWKDQPYDKVELDIVEQLLSPATVKDFHSHRVAIYLKVVSLLVSSLRLAFLYTDKVAVENKERSKLLLKESCEQFPNFLTLYLQNKSFILARIRLTVEEEEDVMKQFSVPTSCFKSYKDNYTQLFSKEKLINTAFSNILIQHIKDFNFAFDAKGLKFSSGINGILTDRFRLIHFITLYNIAKSSAVTVNKYGYLLHHTVIRASINYDRFPREIVMMLAGTLLLVAENPEKFSESPKWFNSSDLTVDLSERSLTEDKVNKALTDLSRESWLSESCSSICPREITYYLSDNKEKAAEKDDEKENKEIWMNLALYDIDRQGVPLCFPDCPESFSLQYESKINSSNTKKRDTVRDLYLAAARNDAMYQFFRRVLKQCDNLKYDSVMGRTVAPFIDNIINKAVTYDELPESPTKATESSNLEKCVIYQSPLVDIEQYFVANQQVIKNNGFLFETQLEGPSNGYQRQFYFELKDSWNAYHGEISSNYAWLNEQSLNELESHILIKHAEISEQSTHMWKSIEKEFGRRPNSESDHYFALRWHSGQVLQYHKGDLITLLVEPHKIVNYNPACLEKRENIIQDLLRYVNFEINMAKLVRVLTCIEEYKQIANESEQFSVLQCLVRNLQENLNLVSYQYPHWLLFQLENDLIVRNNQQELILSMLNQSEKAMYQLNMGEGKSSVILPLLSYSLADGKQLLRINVLPSLFITMKNFLQHRFSGLIRNRIFTVPFYRDTDISKDNLLLISQTLKTCQSHQYILLVTPEHRLCLQLKIRELMLENQQQMNATDIFNWETYRHRVQSKVHVYSDLTDKLTEQLLDRQDQHLKACLLREKYIDQNNRILKVPPRGHGRKEFAQFKESIDDSTFREWSCLKAAYRELLYNSTLAQIDSSEKLALFNEISSISAIDLLDESDEILRHGTELNYAMGDKHLFSGEELRWQIPQFFIEAVFCDSTIRDVITKGKNCGFTTINECSLGGVPFIQLLDELYYEDHIKNLLIDKFFIAHLPSLQKYDISVDHAIVKGEASSLRCYIAGKLSLITEKKVMAFLTDKGSLKIKLLIAKGWLSHGILYHVLSAKYRVQYGLDLYRQGELRKKIAIPFFGKDAPSPRSEFGHPDVMLGFTIISYLYQGLDEQQLKDTLLRLKNKFCHMVADNHLRAWAEANRHWIESQSAEFPPLFLSSFENVDLADEQCLAEIHKYLSGNYLAIFFYLNQFVLLEEAMQYRTKISANAHSLVGYDAALGFSGTDDRKLTMPFQIKSLRSTSEQSTNGKLLSVLTQNRNSRYYSLISEGTLDLLEQLCRYIEKQPHCHALIDAGALVTGLTNYEVASFLLVNLPLTILGILYFSDEGNLLTVLTRDNKIVPLQDCYLDKQNLFAYLDDVHTRGTDIKLPLNCEAILTIGIGMQKDKLMQAAMRLRQLAQKQSVSLWGTQAVTLAIARSNSVDATCINSLEVIKWVTQNTINDINSDLFSVALRKINFQFLQRAETWLKEAPANLDTLTQCCQENELFLLEDFYAVSPQFENLSEHLYSLVDARVKTFWQELQKEMIRKQIDHTAFYKKVFDQTAMHEFSEKLKNICDEAVVYLQDGYVQNSLDNDQEKEVEVEIIQEQQVVIKLQSRLGCKENNWDVSLTLQEDFTTSAEKKGIIMSLNAIKDFIQSPVSIKNIIWHPNIYMTQNFIKSVEFTENEALDNYLRPVDVVLIHRVGAKSRVILLSGQEAARIKSTCFSNGCKNVLVHINDIDGPTQMAVGSTVSNEEHKLLTIIKIFSGECHYASSKEVQRLAKRVGRLYKQFFTNEYIDIDKDRSEKIYGHLIEKGYLDFAGIMTRKLLNVLKQVEEEGKSPSLQLTAELQSYNQYVSTKLHSIFKKLIIKPSSSLKDSHYTLWQWVGTRGMLKEYTGSALETILNCEFQISA